MAKARMSSKDQLVLPREVRERRGWGPGTVFEVEDHGPAVLLRPAKPFAPTTVEEVFGYAGPPRSVEEMDAAVADEARRIWEEFERQTR